MDTIVHFTNLSPYTASVEFRAGDNDCWHDDGAQDGRVQQYQAYYRDGAVSDANYRDFLSAYKGATGITTVAPYVAGQWGRGNDRLPS